MAAKKYISYLTQFITWSERTAGKPMTFIMAITILLGWVVIGFIWGFTNTWLLVITAVATINASLMVFIIQNTQNREKKALHLKLDGIIAAIKEAENQLIAIEELEEDKLEKIRSSLKSKKVDVKTPKQKSPSSYLVSFLTWSSKTAGHAYTTVLAVAFLIIWVIIGLIYGFTDKWILIIDSLATINASLMVFIIQNTQIRENKALHIKVDGIIHSIAEAEAKLIAIEEAEEAELEAMHQHLIKKRDEKLSNP